MNKEIQYIIRNLQNTLNGEPWYGKAVYQVMEEVDDTKASIKPACPAGRPGNSGHSLVELLYHMITWATFCLKHLMNSSPEEIKKTENMDWREIDPLIHNWQKGIKEFKKTHEQIIAILETKNDEFLSMIVAGREFNYRFMLNGLIQHNIYHLGQVVFLKKSLS